MTRSASWPRSVASQAIKLEPRTRPLLYPSNAAGVLENAVNAIDEDLYVTGTNFPAGSAVQIFTVDNQYTWNAGDPLVSRGGGKTTAVQLKPGETRFTVKVANRKTLRPGSYDFIARLGDVAARRPILLPNDIISYGDDTGVVMYIIVNGNIVIDSAGRMKNAPAKFEFSDSFEKGEDVYAAVDPTDVPAVHPGGSYAAYFVVAHQPASYWDGPSPALVDVSGGPEIHRVKYWCINGSRTLVWPAATQPEPIKGYDVIVDFGSVAANDSASYVFDNTYTKGVDFIDGYGAEGFWVFENPGSTGPYAVGTVELNDPAGISGITDPSGTTGPTYPVTLAWARIMYPATVAGTGTPVSGTLPNYPVAVFLHGRHANCDNDGSGPGLSSGGWSCPPSQRIPSHEGYEYIMQQLASQGIFCISINAYDIQADNGVWNYNARGRLVLKFLDKLKDWSDNGTDPFGAIFHNKLDMTKIALSGHSRGGEGVAAAAVLNLTWPTHYSIVAVNAIAPTDQDLTTHYVPTENAYLLLAGARDGDLWNFQGFRTYDRAFPDGAANRKTKALVWVYGANHNYFNTIWTDAAALGSPNPWAGQTDDGAGGAPVMPSADQRKVGLTTIAAFFRWNLQGIAPYREILTGRLKPAAIPNASVFCTLQDADRKAIDNFEQMPLDATTNTLGGAVTAPGFSPFEERRLNHDGSSYAGSPLTDTSYYHDTIGVKLGWPGSPQTYTTLLPAGHRDISMYSHLTFRVGKKVLAAGGSGPDVSLLVQLTDSMGHTGMWPQRTDQFDRIPYPYPGMRAVFQFGMPPNPAQMTGVRIPLRNFTMNNSGVLLNDIVSITFTTEGADEIAIDDIEVGQ
jgi:hypothetical protein